MVLKYKLLSEEEGAEPATTEGGSEEVSETTEEKDFDFDAWLQDDADEDDVDVDEDVAEDEEEPVEEEKEESEPEPEPEKEKELEKWTLKVDGEEIEFDPGNEEKTKEWVQKGMAAQKTWQEAGKIRQQANQFMENFKNNPRQILENPALGIDVVKMAEDILYEKIEEETMSDSEKRMRAELKELRAKEHQKQLEEQQEEARAAKERQTQTLNEIKEVLGASGLPVSQDNINTTVKYMKEAIAAGIGHVNPQTVMEYVKRDFQGQQKQFISSMQIEQLVEFLGKDVVDQIRQHNVQQVLKTRKTVAPKAAPSKPKKKEPNYVGDLADWLNR